MKCCKISLVNNRKPSNPEVKDLNMSTFRNYQCATDQFMVGMGCGGPIFFMAPIFVVASANMAWEKSAP